MIKPNSIDQMWTYFVKRGQLQTVSPTQLSVMEMAFKCGCASMLIEMRGPFADLPEEAGVRTLQRWKQEINDFLV